MSYIFFLPNYVSYSNGIKSLWEAAYLFSKIRKTAIVPFHAGELGAHGIPGRYQSLILPRTSPTDSDIVIYPDMVKGNPLNAKRVARYLMAKPYILNGQGIEKEDGDFLFAFSRAVDENLPQLTILLPDLVELARFKKEKKDSTVAIYYGKCRTALEDTEIKNIIRKFNRIKIITRLIPGSKESLYEEISQASLLVSYDPLSSLAYEANLVGTPSLILDPVFRDAFENFNHGLPGFFYDYKNIENIDLDSLGSKIFSESHGDLNRQIAQNERAVLEIATMMEGWFEKRTEQCGPDTTESDAIGFYKDQWKLSPIINCTSIKSVIAFNLMRRNWLLYICISASVRFISSLRKYNPPALFREISRKIIRRIYSQSEIEFIKWKLAPNSRMPKMNNPDDSPAKDEAFNVGSDLKSLLWRITCT